MICPPVSAWKLAQGWDHCEIRLIPFAGQALSEPGISEGLVRAMDGLRRF
jgi:proline iminopeptidase